MTPTVHSISARLITAALPRPWGPGVPVNHVIVVDVVCSDGVVGHGFTWTPTVGAEAIVAMIEHDVTRYAVGAPAHPLVMWDLLWPALHEAGGSGVTTTAMAGLDIALWDARGRREGQPLADVIGRRRDDVPVYGSGVNRHLDVDDLVDQARRWVGAGYQAVKIKVGLPDLRDDVARVRAVREVIGPDRGLMVDANQRWDLPTARRAIAALAEFDLTWVEEPLRADQVGAYADLRRAVDVPVALGENVRTAHAVRDLLVAGGCDILQPNVARVGGITAFLRIADLAHVFGVAVAPHLLPEVSGPLALALPDETAVEVVEDATFDDLGVLRGPSSVVVDGGRLTARDTPGLGLSFVTG